MQGALPVRRRDPSYREGWEEFCSRKTGHSASFREGKMQDSSGVVRCEDQCPFSTSFRRLRDNDSDRSSEGLQSDRGEVGGFESKDETPRGLLQVKWANAV